jgi:sigma-B regulation protein RsbU (phosphoserine phosphatase)
MAILQSTASELAAHTALATARILIAEDQREIYEALRMALAPAGYGTVFAATPAVALELLRSDAFDLVLMDMNYRRDTTSGDEGLELLRRVQALDADIPVVVLTAWGSVELAVQSMQRGASDFILKPWDNHRLLDVVSRQVNEGRLRRSEHKRHEFAMQEAAEVQRALLPAAPPVTTGMQMAVTYQPVAEIGGDYFDVLDFGHSTGLVIADVVGKGVSAALLMTHLRAAVKATATANAAPDEVCSRLNEMTSQLNLPGKFTSLFYGTFIHGTNRLRYCNAGHLPPIVVRANSTERLLAGGPVLGAMATPPYQCGEVVLESGDRLALYTDGVTEAGSAREEFGEERLVEALVRARGLSLSEMKDAITAEVLAHCEGRPADDLTLIVLEA